MKVRNANDASSINDRIIPVARSTKNTRRTKSGSSAEYAVNAQSPGDKLGVWSPMLASDNLLHRANVDTMNKRRIRIFGFYVQ